MKFFEDIFKEHYAVLCHFAWQFLKDEELSKDAVQEVFLSLLDSEISISPVSAKSFLFSAVKNACLNKLRRNKLENVFLNAQSPEPADEAEFVNKMIKSEVLSEVLKEVSALPTNCQKIFRLGYLEGLKNSEIAEELKISVNTVKTQKKRGLQLIRYRLNPEFFMLFSLVFLK